MACLTENISASTPPPKSDTQVQMVTTTVVIEEKKEIKPKPLTDKTGKRSNSLNESLTSHTIGKQIFLKIFHAFRDLFNFRLCCG